MLPKGKGKLCVVHKGGVGHVERGGSPQAWSGQQDVGVVEDEEQVGELDEPPEALLKPSHLDEPPEPPK